MGKCMYNNDTKNYCVESLRIWSFSGLCFPAVGLNTDHENSE